MVPDIVKPPAIPSAMKGSLKGSGDRHPPRSPKDKVTFAEFTDVLNDTVRNEGGASQEVAEGENNNSLEVPPASCEIISSSSLGSKVTVLETISEHPTHHPMTSSRKVSTDSSNLNTCETARLLSVHDQDRVAD